MARTLLAMNGKKINTLDDLRSNFNGKQMLAFYRHGKLRTWLAEVSLEDQLQQIDDLESDYDDDTMLSLLMAVFELNDEQIKQAAMQEKKEQSKEQFPDLAEEKLLSDGSTTQSLHELELPRSSSPVESETARQVREVIAHQLGLELSKILNTSDLIEDLGADDEDCISIACALEDKFGLEDGSCAKIGAVIQPLSKVRDIIAFINTAPVK